MQLRVFEGQHRLRQRLDQWNAERKHSCRLHGRDGQWRIVGTDITFLGAITNSGTLEPGWEGTFTDTSTLTNKGTLEVPASSFSSIYNFTNLVNKGKFTVDRSLTMNLPSTGVISNTSTGTITVATGQSLAISSTASPQGTVSQDGIIDNNGTVNVEAPVSISGGSICGNRVNVGLDGQASQSLTFVGAVVAGPACATGLDVRSTVHGEHHGHLERERAEGVHGPHR